MTNRYKLRPTNKGYAVATAAFFIVLNFFLANPFGLVVAVLVFLAFLLQRPSTFD